MQEIRGEEGLRDLARTIATMPAKQILARKWCFTAFLLPNDGEKGVMWREESMNHLIYQREKCPDTGREHYQGYVSFKKTVTVGQVQTALSMGKIHVEVCRDPKTAILYCQKQDTRIAGPWEAGQEVSQGKRSDLQDVYALVEQGASMKEIAIAHPTAVMKYHRGIGAIRHMIAPRKTLLNRKVVLLLGASGVGKTRWAEGYWMEEVYCCADISVPWFDGYDGQKIGLLDDYGVGGMPVSKLKHYLDIYDRSVPVKGDFAKWWPILIIITSNAPISEWYPKATAMDIAALERRITTFCLPEEEVELDEWAREWGPKMGLHRECKREREEPVEVEDEEVGQRAEELQEAQVVNLGQEWRLSQEGEEQ